MAVLEDVFKGGNIVTGLALAVGAAVLAPVVLPAVSGLLRPAAKAAIKGGILVYDRGRQAVAELGEMTSDIAAEARADMGHAREAATSEGPGAEPHPA